MPLDPAQRVNYDQIAHLFDEPFRDHPLDENLLAFLDGRSSDTIRILDMGCGTGKQLFSNRQAMPQTSLVGLDRFHGMLEIARNRCDSVLWVQGDSSNPPFKSESFDYISNQFSYPHILDKAGLMAGTYRLLKPGGRFVMTNIDPWRMTGWLIYRYFPASMQRDFSDYLTVEKFTDMMREVGFTSIQVQHQHQPGKQTLKDFLEFASLRPRTSQLMVISDDDYNAGLAAIQADIEKGIVETESELCFITIMGDK